MAASDSVSKNQFHMHLYHGTSKRDLDRIMAAGLGANYGDDKPSVYLTDDPGLALHYAAVAGDGAILKVRANPRNLNVDWNSFEDPVTSMDKKGIDRQHDASKLRHASKDWKNSLKQTGAVVHRGVIPPEDIIGVEKLEY